ncbi:MAG: RNA-binding protein [Nanoarchaeota archaeon]|nr:RNA-binding protein [Nanoarchaeota archaeon]
MTTKIYVGNLAFNMTEKDLKETFATFGEITEAVVISDKFSGRSKGFGFVTFAEESASKKAVEEMDGKEIQGRALKVAEAKPMER